MIPTWAVFVVVVVIVVGYFLMSNAGRQRRRESLAAGFAKLPEFHANQVYADVRGESAIGIDDRGRRIAVARRHARPRTKVYSFAHIVSAELVQNGATIAVVSSDAAARTGQVEASAAEGGSGEDAPPERTRGKRSLFGSTARGGGGDPAMKPVPGPMNMLGVRVVFRDVSDPGVLIRFYAGRAIDVESVRAEKALGGAQAFFGALNIAIRRAGLPPRPATSGSGLGPRG